METQRLEKKDQKKSLMHRIIKQWQNWLNERYADHLVVSLGRTLHKAILRIDTHLRNMEQEYTDKKMPGKLRYDRQYNYYSGKLIAYLYVMQELKIPVPNILRIRELQHQIDEQNF